MSAAPPVIETLGQRALLLRFGDAIDLRSSQRVHALVARLQAQRPAAVREIVPAYASVAVEFVAGTDAASVRAELGAWLARAAAAVDGDSALDAEVDVRATPAPGSNAAVQIDRTPDVAPSPDGAHRASARMGVGTATAMVEIPVRYDGPDLAALAQHAGMSVDEVVRRHTAPLYTVAMIGFAPGFPYLLGMDPALAMPRLERPRSHVAAGSVGIADAQTGIYPQASPGGWRLLGHTGAVLFDPAADPPVLLHAGMQVRLRAR